MSRTLGDLALEAGAIILSVLAALAVDEWREGRANAALVARATASIVDEVRANRAEIRRAVAYHDSLVGAMAERRHVQVVLTIPRAQAMDAMGDARRLRDLVTGALARAGIVIGSPLTVIRMDESTFDITGGHLRGAARLGPEGLAILVNKGISLRSAFVRNVAWETALATQAPQHMDYPVVAAMSELFQLQREYATQVHETVGLIYAGSLDPWSLSDLASLEHSLARQYDVLARLIPAVDSAAAPRH